MPADRSKYPDNWEQISRRIRYQRAAGFCECQGECGSHDGECCAANGSPHPVTGSTVVLTVAHLDHDTTNNNEANLLAMCQRCHLTYDAAYHAINARLTRARKAGQLWLPWVRGGADQ